MAWHNGDYSAITTPTLNDIIMLAQSGQTVTATLEKIKALLGICSSCVLSSDSTLAGTPANTTITTLFTYALPPATLSTDGWFVRVIAWGLTGNNVNTKDIYLNFGSEVFNTAFVALTDKWWCFESIIRRTAAGNQDIFTRFDARTNAGTGTSTITGFSKFAEATENLNGAVNIVVRGHNGTASASDVRYEGSIILLNS